MFDTHHAQSTRNVPAARLYYNVILLSPLLLNAVYIGTPSVIRSHRSRYTVKTSNQHDASTGNCNFAQKVRRRQTSTPTLISRPPPPVTTHTANPRGNRHRSAAAASGGSDCPRRFSGFNNT